MLSDVNVGIGLSIFTYSYASRFVESGVRVWLYLAYTITVALLFVLGQPLLSRCCREVRKRRKERQRPEEVELRSREERDGEEDNQLVGKKMCSKESCHLWVSFAFFLGLTVAVVMTLVVLVAI